MSAAANAVFLSYASQDADAARKICEAFRGAGIEVWLDQSGLVGGDAWDQKIRGQIKACTLFVPIISANTQARREGYFRREWKQAAARTHDMADGTPFLLPVVIDGTSDAGALVPEEFRAVQWTRLPDGEPTSAFCERVKNLLGLDRRDFPPKSPELANEANHRRLGATPLPSKRARWTTRLMVTAAVLVALAVWQPWRHVPVAEASDKSIAVLPFANGSDDKENTAFFTDGMHEDIMTNLTNIRDLRVVSRTSVMEYRDTTKKIPQIARELGVAYILQGSVRRAGNQVRITGQLIRAANDKNIWANRYDRELTPKEMFAIQASLATEIAGALQAAIAPETKKLLDQRPTENLAAYEAYLKARQLQGSDLARGEARVALFDEAVRLDPKFALAWANLSFAHGVLYLNRIDQSPARAEKAKVAIENAMRLAPDHPEVILRLGRYHYSVFNDYARALEQYQRVARLQPNNPEVWRATGAVHRRAGRWLEAVADLRKATALDSAGTAHRRSLLHTLIGGRLYEQAQVEVRELVARDADKLPPAFDAARLAFEAKGSTQELERFVGRLTPQQAATATGWEAKKALALWTGQDTSFLELDRQHPAQTFAEQIDVAVVLAARGDVAGSRARLPGATALRSQVESDPRNAELWSRLAYVEALGGHNVEAVKCARRAMELYPESVDTMTGPRYRGALAFALTWTGEKDQALAEYARLLRTPFSEVNIHVMRRSPHYAPLRGDPRFEALLNDPKNNAPLF